MVFESTILARREVAKGSLEVAFKRPADFSFVAGQHLQIAVPKLTYPDPKGASRLFSIVSSPDDFSKLQVAFRLSGSGFKETMKELPLGSNIKIEQASGNFILPKSPTHQQVFVAGGIGIAPFMGYLYQVSPNIWKQKITLFYGNRNRESAAYLDELRLITNQQSNFSLQEMYQPPTQELFMQLPQKYPNATWWIVGPPGMVAVTVNGLESGGVPAEHIRTEAFDGY